MEQRRIVVVGAGVVGAALARRLVRGGARVTVLERDEPGRGTSRWSMAWLNSNAKTPRTYHDLNARSMAAWARLAEDMPAASWYRPVGGLRWVEGEEARRELAERVERLRGWGYGAEFVDRRRAAELEPGLALPAGAGDAAWFPEEGYVLTEPLIGALLDEAKSRGAEVRTGPAGEVVAVEAAGRDGLVVTADGGRVTADAVVCCVGRWTPELTRTAVAGCGAGSGVALVDPAAPGSPAPGVVVRAGPVVAPPLRMLHTPQVHVRAHGADAVHLESNDAAAVDLDTPAAELDRWAATLLERARHVLPSMAAAGVTERRVCVRPLPLDGLPLVGPVGPGDGAADGGAGRTYVIATHSGVTLAAGLAELVARELLEDVRAPELAPFRPDRPGAG